MTESSLGDLTVQLAKLVDTLETSEAARAANDKTRADAEKTKADAEKARADADKVVAETEGTRASARADVEAKEIANVKARSELQAAQVDKLIEQATGAVPNLAGLSKNTVTFSEGRVLREGEALRVALDLAAEDVATALRTVEGQSHLYVVSNANLLADVVTYRRVLAEASTLAAKVDEARDDATSRLEEVPPSPTGLAATGSALVLASLAAAIGTQVASLFEVDLDLKTHESIVPALSVHSAVLGKLLTPPKTATHQHGASQTPSKPTSSWVVHHELARVPPASWELMTEITKLIAGDVGLARLDAGLKDAIAALGDPDARLADATEVLHDPKASAADKADAQGAARAAAADKDRLAELVRARAGIAGVLERLRSFSDRVTSPGSGNGASVLASAVAVEPIANATDKDAPHVLVLGPAGVISNQLVVARRLFAPRVQVSVALTLDYVLIKGDVVVRAGRVARAAAYLGVAKSHGFVWASTKPLAAV